MTTDSAVLGRHESEAPTTTTATPKATAGSPAAAKSRRSARKRFGRFTLAALGIIIALLWAFPVYWMLNSSFLPGVTLERTTPTLVPFGGSLNNFRSVLQGGSFLSALGMSLIAAGIAVIVCLIFAFFAALALSRFRFKGRRSFVLAVLFVQMLPAEGMFIAQYKLLGSLEMRNIIGVSILYIAAVVPFTIWMLRGFVAGIPIELEEAAMVDGLSRTKAFIRITFPLLAPGLIASGVYAFLQAWNEFTIALVILPAEQATLPLWLRTFIQQSSARAIDWGEVMAASTLVAVPVIFFFVLVQGRMTSGLVSGAVKG